MILAADNLSLMRGDKCVLREVSTALEPGKMTAIVGPNGAGKSSLLEGLAGLLSPAAGSVSLDDRPLARMAVADRVKAIGYLPQVTEIAWDIAVESLVALGRIPAHYRGKEAVERAIAALSLGDLRDRPASQLSGGEQARALLARVLAGEPQWVLADEPLAALDLAHQSALVRHFKAIAGQGKGVVVVLHDLAMAINHADQVLVLREGRLVAEGRPEEALTTAIIENAWGVKARWVGNEGAKALIIG